MQKTRDRFVIDDPKSYTGNTFRYHVGFGTTNWFGSLTLHSATVETKLEIQTAEDLEYMRKRLFENAKKRGARELIILGFSRLQK